MILFRRKERSMLEAGEPAPDFEVLDHTGAKRRLSDYRGKTVVLWFYPAADTPG
jgi:thioredoxin-dependent peroxiredoxin